MISHIISKCTTGSSLIAIPDSAGFPSAGGFCFGRAIASGGAAGSQEGKVAPDAPMTGEPVGQRRRDLLRLLCDTGTNSTGFQRAHTHCHGSRQGVGPARAWGALKRGTAPRRARTRRSARAEAGAAEYPSPRRDAPPVGPARPPKRCCQRCSFLARMASATLCLAAERDRRGRAGCDRAGRAETGIVLDRGSGGRERRGGGEDQAVDVVAPRDRNTPDGGWDLDSVGAGGALRLRNRPVSAVGTASSHPNACFCDTGKTTLIH
jgi:hypothetical protein